MARPENPMLGTKSEYGDTFVKCPICGAKQWKFSYQENPSVHCNGEYKRYRHTNIQRYKHQQFIKDRPEITPGWLYVDGCNSSKVMA